MIVTYIFLFYILIVYFFLKRKKINYIILYLFPMFITLGTQVGIGTDYESYIFLLKFPEKFKNSKGIGFRYLLEFLNKFNNERIFFLVIAFFQMFFLFLILRKIYELKIIKNVYLYFIILIISTPIYFQMFNSLRTSITSLIFILAILKKKKINYIIILILGNLIHPSILLYLPLIFLKNKLDKMIKKQVLILYLVSCFIGARIKVIYIIVNYIYNLNFDFKYKSYLVSSHMYPYTKKYGLGMTIQLCFFLFFIIYFYKKREDIYLINLGIISFGLKILFSQTPILARILEYFNVLLALVVYELIVNTTNKRHFFLGSFIIIFYIMSFFRGSMFML